MWVTPEQKAVLQMIVKDFKLLVPPSPLNRRAEELDLEQAFNKDPYTEGRYEDILVVAESDEVKLTDDELHEVYLKVERYDHSDYNNFISDCIREVKGEM